MRHHEYHEQIMDTIWSFSLINTEKFMKNEWENPGITGIFPDGNSHCQTYFDSREV